MRRLLACFAAVGTLYAAVTSASAAGIGCPESIEPREELASRGDGWQVEMDPGRPPARHLEGIGFFLGAPRDGGSLAPDSERKVKDTLTATWTFPRSGGEEFWLACTYADTRLMLVRKLGPAVTACSVEYRLSAKGLVLGVKEGSCR